MHMRQGSTAPGEEAAAGCLCRLASGEVGSPRIDRQGGLGWDRDGHLLPPGEPAPFLWQRFSKQLVLSKAFLQ